MKIKFMMTDIRANILKKMALNIMPISMEYRIRVFRKLRNFRHAGLIFIHVPRNAGSSISSAIYGEPLGHFTMKDIQAVAPKIILGLPRLAVVRNPWDRLVSAYHFAKAGGGEDRRGIIRNPNLYNIPAFQNFENFVENWLCKQDISKVDEVFRLQTEYLIAKDGNFPYNYLGRYEDINSTIDWLQKINPKFSHLPRYNYTERCNFKTYYNDRTRDIVGKIYKKDIQNFGYTFDL